MDRIKILRNRLKNKEKILLAGACGTEIQRRDVETTLPLWSASALLTHPEVVRTIHEDYIDAGADIITTNTFRTNRRTLEKINKGEQARELTRLAVSLAQEARKRTGKIDVVIGGSVAPLEDCYQPTLVPSDDKLLREHSEQARYLADSGVDFIFIETMNAIREAKAAMEGCQKAGLFAAISFVCNADGNLLSGESIEDALSVVLPFNPIAILTNCSPPKIAEVSLYKLLKIANIPVGIYANGDGHPDDRLGWKFIGNMPPEEYLIFTEKWLRDGVSIIGGCCGTNPEYIKLIRQFIS